MMFLRRLSRKQAKRKYVQSLKLYIDAVLADITINNKSDAIMEVIESWAHRSRFYCNHPQAYDIDDLIQYRQGKTWGFCPHCQEILQREPPWTETDDDGAAVVITEEEE